jgi:hypothetical protein
MSVIRSFRKLLRSIHQSIDCKNRRPFVEFVKGQYRSCRDEGSKTTSLQLASELADHLQVLRSHRETLRRYNITINRDASQREYVESVAQRVGLKVPCALPPE